MPIQWRPQLSIDGDLIDQDHQTLIAIINSFEAVQPGAGEAARLADVLAQLDRYAQAHFHREEMLQRKVAFPFAQGHNQQHRLLLRNLDAAREEFAAAASGQDLAMFRLHMCGFLHDWLLDHIIQNDLLMKPFVQAMAPHAARIGSLQAAMERRRVYGFRPAQQDEGGPANPPVVVQPPRSTESFPPNPSSPAGVRR